MFEHISAALQNEETGHGNTGQLVQAHMPSMGKEFQTHFPDLNALDSNFIRSVILSNVLHDNVVFPTVHK